MAIAGRDGAATVSQPHNDDEPVGTNMIIGDGAGTVSTKVENVITNYMDDLFHNQYRISSARADWHGYDGGLYFVTICTADMVCSFGEIADGIMSLSALGRYVEEAVLQVPFHHLYAEIPLYVVMPNHIHLVVYIDGGNVPFERRRVADAIPVCRDGACTVSRPHSDNVYFEPGVVYETGDGAGTVSTKGRNRWKTDVVDDRMQIISNQKGWLSVVIGSFKSSVTRFAHQSAIPFAWQTRFHEHIIRSREEGNRIAEYIENNVAQWDVDCFYRK